MVTRVRIEAEGSTPEEALEVMETARQRLVMEGDPFVLDRLFGHPTPGGGRPGLVDQMPGECNIERFARKGGPGIEGQVFFKGRMVVHFAKPSAAQKLKGHAVPDVPDAVWSHCPWCGVELAPTDPNSVPIVAEHKQGCPTLGRFEVTEQSGNWTRIGAHVGPPTEAQPIGTPTGDLPTPVPAYETTVDRVPPLNRSTDAPLTVERLVETWNKATESNPTARPHTRLRLYAVPGDTFVRAVQLWQTDDQLQVLYEYPVEHPNLSPRSWLVSPQAGAGG